MELYQLRSFVIVAELGHLTRASERLHLSQPALSAQIKALEDELGVALFDRSSSGMTLTAAGRRLLPEADAVVSAARALKHAARALRGEVGGRVRVGTLADPEFIRVAEFLSEAIDRFPALEIELEHEVSGVAFEKVRDGVLDASFYYGELAHPAVASLPLREIAYRVAAPVAWRREIEAAGWEDVAALPWVMAPPVSTHYALATEWFRGRGLAPSKRIEADNDVVISALVVGGLGVALMREDLALAAEAAGQVCLWSDARLATQLQFVYRTEREKDPVLQGLLQVLARVWAAPGGGAEVPTRTRDGVAIRS
jgi:DNA-binding transcriptional LysR family regulator